jgi:hypothetical protein
VAKVISPYKAAEQEHGGKFYPDEIRAVKSKTDLLRLNDIPHAAGRTCAG